MNVDNEKIKSIIVKSVLGTLTEEENFVLEGWLQENDRNKVLYQKLSSAVELKYKYEQYEGVDVAEAFRRNQRRLRQDVPNRMMKKLLPYAATVLLLFSGAFCFLMNRSGEVREEVPVALSAGGKYAELILANGQKVDLHEGMEIKLREMGDPVLNKTCKPVTEVTERIAELIEDMFETMYDADGVGLAAPQVGILKRIVVIDVTGEDPILLINPVIIETSGEQTGNEGCLSLPGKTGVVTRPNYVKVRAYDEEMKPFEIEGTELLARAFCHEIDHLDGHLYVEKVEGELMSTESPEQ